MTLSLIYGLIVAAVVAFQIALLFGAPWGRLTQGGQVDGALPWTRRLAAVASAGLLIAMAFAMRSAEGGWPGWPIWTAWATLAVSVASMLMNWITPSKPERLLWGPVTTVMFLLVAAILWS